MRRTKQDAELTRKLIIDAALERFAARGIDACSLVEIARCASLTRGAIYWHFKNKSELLDAIVEDFASPLIIKENAILDENETDPLGKLRDLLIYLLTSIANDPVFRRIIILCQRMRTLSFNEDSDSICQSAYLCKLTEQRLERRVQILDSAISKNQLPSNIDSRAAANFIFASVEGIAFAWLVAPEGFMLGALAPSYVDSILTGITQIKC